MSHLRPLKPGTLQVKKLSDYTKSETLGAFTEMNDAATQRLAANKTLDRTTMQKLVKLAEDLDKTDSLDGRIFEAANRSDEEEEKLNPRRKQVARK